MPFGAVQLVATMGGAWAATALSWKSPVLAFLSLPPIAGCVMLLHLSRNASEKGPLLVAYYLVSLGLILLDTDDSSRRLICLGLTV